MPSERKSREHIYSEDGISVILHSIQFNNNNDNNSHNDNDDNNNSFGFLFFLYLIFSFSWFYLFIPEKNANQCMYNSFLY